MIFVIAGGRDRTAGTPTAESPSSCAGRSPRTASRDRARSSAVPPRRAGHSTGRPFAVKVLEGNLGVSARGGGSVQVRPLNASARTTTTRRLPRCLALQGVVPRLSPPPADNTSDGGREALRGSGENG